VFRGKILIRVDSRFNLYYGNFDKCETYAGRIGVVYSLLT